VKAEKYDRQALDIEQKLAPGGLPLQQVSPISDWSHRNEERWQGEEYYRRSAGHQQKLAPGAGHGVDR